VVSRRFIAPRSVPCAAPALGACCRLGAAGGRAASPRGLVQKTVGVRATETVSVIVSRLCQPCVTTAQGSLMNGCCAERPICTSPPAPTSDGVGEEPIPTEVRARSPMVSWPVPCRSPCTRSRGRAARSQSGRRRKAIHPQRRSPPSVLAVRALTGSRRRCRGRLLGVTRKPGGGDLRGGRANGADAGIDLRVRSDGERPARVGSSIARTTLTRGRTHLLIWPSEPRGGPRGRR